jgi:high-affinity iron transporter
MLSTSIVIFREILEIAIILSVVMVASKELEHRNRWVAIGVLAGISGSVIVAIFAQSIANAAEGMGQEFFNASILLTATVVIGATALWMSKHAKHLTAHLRHVSTEVIQGNLPLYSISVVIGLAILREGAEIVLFTHGMIASGQSIASILIGSAMGFALGSAVGAAMYFGLLKISPKHVFGVTTWLLMFLCAGMAATAAKYLVSAGWFESLSNQLWDSSFILDDANVFGQILHALLGYTARPMALQFIFYLTTLGILIMSMKLINRKPSANTKPALVAIAFTAMVCLNSGDAHATKKIYKPYVEKGEIELEWKFGHDFDDNNSKDGKEKQKFGVGYGVTDKWFTELYPEIEKEAGDNRDYKMTALEWENIFQLTEKGQYAVDFGVLAAYDQSFENDKASKVEAKLLFAKDTGQFSHTMNITFENEVGQHAQGELETGLAWGTRYRLNPYFEPGFEYHAEFGRLDTSSDFDEQEHQIGPVAYGKLPYGFKYDVGYLFGISDESPDGALKSIIEYEMRF